MLTPGTPAPEIELADQHGRPFKLTAQRGVKNVVVYFYPMDDTRVCTIQACGFRDAYADLVGMDTEVVGISAQEEASHQRFASKYELPFTLLTDAGAKVRKAYGVRGFLALVPGRVTYVIDKQGIIRAATKDMFDGERHVREALEALRVIEGRRMA